MMRSFIVFMALCMAAGITGFAQQSQNPPDNPKPNATQPPTNTAPQAFPFPEEQSKAAAEKASGNASVPPRSDEDSSSKNTQVDLSPPPGDSKHPGSDLLGPEPSPDVTEMKPWNPHKADKDVEVGTFYFKRGNYSAAESRYREALYWQDNHAVATYRLATTLEKEGKPEQAKQYYSRYLKILPEGEFAKDCKKALEKLTSESDKKAENKAPSVQP